MAFKDFPAQPQGVQLLQRSLERGRLAQAYLFSGDQLAELEALGRTLAKTLNCSQPVKRGSVSVDCCDRCSSCKKIQDDNHPDVHWLRPESKLRLIKMDQMVERPTSRETPLLNRIHLRPFEAEYKFAIIVAADRMNEEAANAFLKTLEEPPPKSILILLSTEPARILETIRSRCLWLNFAGQGQRPLEPTQMAWVASFSEMAAAEQKSLLGRYCLLDALLKKLNELKKAIEEALTARSPLQRYAEAERDLQEKWEDELKAAIEAEYRRKRAELLLVLQTWLRDVWLETLKLGQKPAGKGETQTLAAELLSFPKLGGTSRVAERISAKEALENLGTMEQLQLWLGTNVQEALALEVGLLQLRL